MAQRRYAMHNFPFVCPEKLVILSRLPTRFAIPFVSSFAHIRRLCRLLKGRQIRIRFVRACWLRKQEYALRIGNASEVEVETWVLVAAHARNRGLSSFPLLWFANARKWQHAQDTAFRLQ